MGGRTAKALGATIAVLVLGIASTAGGKPVPEGPLEGKLSADFTPRMLAKKGQTPIALRTLGRFWTDDGSPVPPLRWYRLQVDPRMRLNLGEVPVCGGGVRSQPRGEGLPEHCRDSIVGQAGMEVDVHFPGAAPVLVDGEGTIYRGPSRDGGGPKLYLNTFFGAPVAAEIVVPLEVTRTVGGRYGLQLDGAFPKIAGGSGSVTRIDLRFRTGVFTASCPSDRELLIGQRTIFDDRSLWSGSTARACTASG